MIEIINEEVIMPPYNERRFQYKSLDPNGKKWEVLDEGRQVYKGNYVNATIISYNLNKKYYRDL